APRARPPRARRAAPSGPAPGPGPGSARARARRRPRGGGAARPSARARTRARAGRRRGPWRARCVDTRGARGLQAGPRRGAASLLGVGREDVGDAQREPLRRRDVEELVGAVRVGAGPEDAGDAELRLGELLAEHVHERDRATLTRVHRRLAEVAARGVVERLLEP